jgi:hydrogenase nickel incorporation protein HypA/HybF
MHELAIANSVLEAVQEEAKRHLHSVPVKVGVRLGELAGVDPDALAFSFQALTSRTAWERLALEIETCPRRHRCPACGNTFCVADYRFTCPACGEPRTECIAGDELELTYVELEES